MAMASDLETGNYFMHNGEPVRVVRKEVVAFGTHSHSKLKLFVQGLTEKGERIVNLQHKDRVDIVEVIRKLGQVISKSNNELQVMDMVSYETNYATSDEELYNTLNEGDNVTFIDIQGKMKIIEKRANA